jgi:hypothetical protein
MSGAIRLLPPYAFMKRTGATLLNIKHVTSVSKWVFRTQEVTLPLYFNKVFVVLVTLMC